jgi:hypothetical protein
MSSNQIPSPPERFKINLLTLFDIINDMFEEGIENGVIDNQINLLSVMKIVIRKASSDYMLRRFIKRTNEHWDKILDEDIDYFKNKGLELFNMVQDKGVDAFKGEEELNGDNKLVNSLSGDHVNNFKRLLEATYVYEGEEIDIFDDDRRSDVWKIMQSFVRISLCYIHETRKPVEGKYTVEFFPEIKVKTCAEKWGVKLV